MEITVLLKEVFNFLIVAAPFLIIFYLVFRAAQRRAQKRLAVETIQKALEEMKEKITVVTTAEVPGRTIEKVLGPVSAEGEAYSGFFSASEKRALVLLMHRALLLGADAVVELRRATPATDVRGASRRHVNRIRFFGTAVKLAEVPGDQERMTD
jgi:preprotein translocase subunit YajC